MKHSHPPLNNRHYIYYTYKILHTHEKKKKVFSFISLTQAPKFFQLLENVSADFKNIDIYIILYIIPAIFTDKIKRIISTADHNWNAHLADGICVYHVRGGKI